jgi:hypothetical protein
MSAATAPATKRVVKTPKYPYYRALRRLVVGKKVYKPGQVVPEATSWTRVEAWVRSRHLRLIAGPEDEA